MSTPPAITITNGKAVTLTIDWLNPAREPDTPTAVKYQVFDWLSGVSTHLNPVVVGSVGASMEFTVPASLLPAGSSSSRRLAIEIEAEFTGPTDKDYERVDVTVLKGFALSTP